MVKPWPSQFHCHLIPLGQLDYIKVSNLDLVVNRAKNNSSRVVQCFAAFPPSPLVNVGEFYM